MRDRDVSVVSNAGACIGEIDDQEMKLYADAEESGRRCEVVELRAAAELKVRHHFWFACENKVTTCAAAVLRFCD